MNRKYRVGIIGATGYVGQRFVSLLDQHPWFEVTKLAASARSAGKKYGNLMEKAWKLSEPLPEAAKDLLVMDSSHLDEFCQDIDFCFCAVDMAKEEIVKLEEAVAKREVAVISNNSANRWTADVPMIIPEINYQHSDLIKAQRKRLGTRKGFIAVKPNCSIQSYVPALTPLLDLDIKQVLVTTYQAVSGAGKKLEEWPEIVKNVIPYIGGEEEKSEKEPLKVWGKVSSSGDKIDLATNPVISAQCYRVPVQDGHLAAVSVKFDRKTSLQEIIDRWKNYETYPNKLGLPSAPQPFIHYFDQVDRPQPKLDRMLGKGYAVAIGRLREDPIFDYKFTCLSHNTIRGAAGGAILTAELLVKQGYLELK